MLLFKEDLFFVGLIKFVIGLVKFIFLFLKENFLWDLNNGKVGRFLFKIVLF